MAPTEILAEQHARTLARLLAPLGIEAALLTGRLSARRASATLADAVAAGEAGAARRHARADPGDACDSSGSAWSSIDEQHRFGVRAARRAEREGRDARTCWS